MAAGRDLDCVGRIGRGDFRPIVAANCDGVGGGVCRRKRVGEVVRRAVLQQQNVERVFDLADVSGLSARSRVRRRAFLKLRRQADGDCCADRVYLHRNDGAEASVQFHRCALVKRREVCRVRNETRRLCRGGVGNVWLDKAYQQKDAGVSTKKYTFVGHANSDIIGKCTNTVKYGQTMDFSDAVLFNSVQMKDVEIQYKSTANVSPTLCTFGTANYSYSYSSSDPSKVSVDKDGNVKGLKQSSAVINCNVTDSNGSAASDSCTVTVKYAWWQWIIVIFLFGWIWY